VRLKNINAPKSFPKHLKKIRMLKIGYFYVRAPRLHTPPFPFLAMRYKAQGFPFGKALSLISHCRKEKGACTIFHETNYPEVCAQSSMRFCCKLAGSLSHGRLCTNFRKGFTYPPKGKPYSVLHHFSFLHKASPH
jgi:hypothetical protein